MDKYISFKTHSFKTTFFFKWLGRSEGGIQEFLKPQSQSALYIKKPLSAYFLQSTSYLVITGTNRGQQAMIKNRM